MMRKRTPTGKTVDRLSDLDTTTWYRTPMDDSSHLWDGVGNGTLCGRYLEYPQYYSDGWDLIFGPYWVQVDERKNGQCALCKGQVKARDKQIKLDMEAEAAARKFSLTTRHPEGLAVGQDERRSDIERWSKAARHLYVG